MYNVEYTSLTMLLNLFCSNVLCFFCSTCLYSSSASRGEFLSYLTIVKTANTSKMCFSSNIEGCFDSISLKFYPLDPLSPPDALKHHFTSLKTDLIFLQPRVLE